MLHKQLSLAVVAASALVTQVAGDCNPLTSSSCGSNDALSSTYSYDFSDGEDGSNWSSIGQGDPNYDSNGAHFVVKKKGDAPTIESSWYILFGRVEVHMKAAPGTGIVSSSVLLSDDLDEIDWEWLGGNPNAVQTNYFSKGDTTTTGREVDAGVANSQSTTHNYTIDWNKDACTWYIDGNAVRTLPYSDTYPQTPMRVKLGIWAGGDSDNAEGTIEWAGGKTDFGDAPFTMSVESIKVTNYNPAKSYSYGDRTGVYESIKVDGKGDDSSSSDSESSTTLKTKTKTKTASSTSGSSTTLSTVSASTTAATSTPDAASSTPYASTSGADTGSTTTPDGSSSTPTSSQPATVSGNSVGESISPNLGMILSAIGLVLFGYF